MSHSPVEGVSEGIEEVVGKDRVRDYAQGWVAINKLMRTGWSWSGNEANNAFLNLGPDADGVPRFVDASGVLGFDAVVDGRALVRLDVDWDGDLDLALSSRDGPRLRVLRNDLPQPHAFVALRLVDGLRNPTGVGARVELTVAGEGGQGRTLVRSVRAGEGFLAQQPGWLHFGLGAGEGVPATAPDPVRVQVRWADGVRELFDGVHGGAWHVLRRGTGVAQPWSPPAGPRALQPGAVRAPEPVSSARIVLPQPLAMPEVALVEANGTEQRIFGIQAGGQARGTGRPLLISLWASWCTPCIAEFGALRDAADDLGALGILALSVDQGAARETASDILERVRWPFPAAFAPPETQAVLGVLVGALLDSEEPLSIPLGLLINGRGELVCVYIGRVAPERLLADLRLLRADPAQRALAASPFRGIWYRAPEAPGAALLEARFRARGLDRQADDCARAQVELKEGDEARVLYNLARRAMERDDLEEVIRLLRRALVADPRLVEAWGDLGVALHRQGSFDQAVDAYSTALLLADDAALRAKRGLAYVELGRLDLAQGEVDHLLKVGAPEAEALALEIERARDR